MEPYTHGPEGIYLPPATLRLIIFVVVFVVVATLRMRGLDLVAAVGIFGVTGLLADRIIQRLIFDHGQSLA